jgi:hypothetical protein
MPAGRLPAPPSKVAALVAPGYLLEAVALVSD